ncbi:hypothetical protein C8J56DRAFT_290410 [Mycena floridula]|nr:hypothetical protein C8J56DRAFT_290410 [Mycena floridula]
MLTDAPQWFFGHLGEFPFYSDAQEDGCSLGVVFALNPGSDLDNFRDSAIASYPKSCNAPNDPDMQGYAVRISFFVMHLYTSMSLFLFPLSDTTPEKSYLVMCIPVAIGTLANIKRQTLTVSDAEFALAVVYSPLWPVLLWRASKRLGLVQILVMLLALAWLVLHMIIWFYHSAFSNGELCAQSPEFVQIARELWWKLFFVPIGATRQLGIAEVEVQAETRLFGTITVVSMSQLLAYPSIDATAPRAFMILITLPAAVLTWFVEQRIVNLVAAIMGLVTIGGTFYFNSGGSRPLFLALRNGIKASICASYIMNSISWCLSIGIFTIQPSYIFSYGQLLALAPAVSLTWLLSKLVWNNWRALGRQFLLLLPALSFEITPGPEISDANNIALRDLRDRGTVSQ